MPIEDPLNYCPVCKSHLTNKIIDGCNRRRCSSDSCGYIFWNNPIPVVGGIIETEDGIVLARNRGWKENIYSIITGFIEPQESPMDAISRE